MMDQPRAVDLIKAVQSFLEHQAIPQLTGHTAFHARVATNALAIVARELELGPCASDREIERLEVLLGARGNLRALNEMLCVRIKSGAMSLDDPSLVAHLRLTTVDKVQIDQPSYSGLKAALE
jgi:hypothetical protein